MPTIFVIPSSGDPTILQAAADAAMEAFPNAPLQKLPNVDAALLSAPRKGTTLLILVEADMAEIKLAVESVDEEGLPRWAFALLGGGVTAGGPEVVAREEWSLPLLKHVFRSAVVEFELARENARFRGDLHTMGRRISHDLRTPLSGIFTTAELLQEILAEISPDDVPLVTPLYDSTQAELRLIDRVSQLLKATVEPKPAELVEMDKVFWAARQSVERELMKKGASLTEPEVWPEAQGVPAWLEMIWGNLLMNAVIHGGDSPRVEAGWKELDGEHQFWVVDDGPGVPEARRPLLFYPFHRLHQRTSAHGLGLSIVQRLVDLQGGRCGYEPLPSGGSKFFFTLPLPSGS